MIDLHIHPFQGNSGEYTLDLINCFVKQANASWGCLI